MATTSVLQAEAEVAGRATPEFSFPVDGASIREEHRLEAGSVVFFSSVAWAGQQGNLNIVGATTAQVPFLFRRKGESRWTPLPPDTWVRAEWISNIKWVLLIQEFSAPWDLLHILKETDLAKVQVLE